MGSLPSVFMNQTTEATDNSEILDSQIPLPTSSNLVEGIRNAPHYILAGGGLILKAKGLHIEKESNKQSTNPSANDNNTMATHQPHNHSDEALTNYNSQEFLKSNNPNENLKLNHSWPSYVSEQQTISSQNFTHNIKALSSNIKIKTKVNQGTYKAEDSEKIQQYSLGFSFSPAGLLISYHLGVISYLKEMCILKNNIPIAGASSGALACLALTSNIDKMQCLQIVNTVCIKAKEKGSAGRLQEFLSSALEELLPDNVHEIANNRPAGVTIAITEVFPLKGNFIDHFYSREDLIECLMASCNIPFYFSNWPLVRFRGKQCVDGYFAVPRSDFGCPPTNALRNIKIVPFNIRPTGSATNMNELISPDMSRRDKDILEYLESMNTLRNRYWIETSSGFHISNLFEVPSEINSLNDYTNPSIPLDIDKPPTSVLALLGIFPPRLFSYQFMAAPLLIENRWAWNQILRFALEGAEEPIVQELYDMGRVDCFRWLVCDYIQLDKLLLENWTLVWGLLIHQIESLRSQIDTIDFVGEFPSTHEKTISKTKMKILSTTLIEKLTEARIIGSQYEHILSHEHQEISLHHI